MERKDREITVHQEWETIGRAIVDQSTTELAGTRREADLIVAGLKVLRAQQEMARAAEVLIHPGNSDHDGQRLPSSDEVIKLIESIENPNYVAEPEVRKEYF